MESWENPRAEDGGRRADTWAFGLTVRASKLFCSILHLFFFFRFSNTPTPHYSNTPFFYFISLGCPVHESTVLQKRPSGSIFLRLETAMRMGTWVNSPFQLATTMFVRPLMPA